MSLNANRTQLDQQQIFQRSFDETQDRIRTDSVANLSFDGELNVELRATDGDTVNLGNSSGDVATYTNVGPKTGLDINVLNQLETQPTGLTRGLKSSRVLVRDTATAVPLTPFTDRNSMTIRVLENVTVWFGDSSVTAGMDGTGYPKYQNEEFIVDVKDNPEVEVYAICESGQQCKLAILELA